MQATATRRALRDLAPSADRTLGTIAGLSSSALGEVRTLLKTLTEESPAWEPGVEDVEHLVGRLSAPHLRIAFRRSGRSRPLAPALSHTAYRVAQEALTNAVRHSGATEVDLHVRQGHKRMVISVADNGPIQPSAGPAAEGQGIRGMRERVLACGGTLAAGPREPHGWLVEAELPITEEPG